MTPARIHRLLQEEGDRVGETTAKKVVREVGFELRDVLEHAYLPLE